MKAIMKDDRRRLPLEVRKEVDRYFEERCLDIDTATIWILHTVFGFGKDRCKRFFDSYIKEVRQAQAVYGDSAAAWMRLAMKRSGVDVEAWEREAET